jgi:hypothetical protein
MNILDSLLGGSGDTGVVSQLAGRFGLDEDQARSAIASLVPALAGGVQRNTASPGGLESLLAALQGGQHQRYLDDPATLGTDESVADGNGILSHVLGSKDVSRQVAQRAASQTGVGADVLKKMLPLVAGLVMAHLSKKAAATPTEAPAQAGGGGLLESLTGLLGGSDGKVDAGDLLGMARKIL